MSANFFYGVPQIASLFAVQLFRVRALRASPFKAIKLCIYYTMLNQQGNNV